MNDFYQHVAQRLHCYEWAGLAGGVLVSFMPEVYIIETHNHAVNFDSENTLFCKFLHSFIASSTSS